MAQLCEPDDLSPITRTPENFQKLSLCLSHTRHVVCLHKLMHTHDNNKNKIN